MPNIQLLDQNTINRIAAGEVIERPASVVKELLENAIDAKATAVTVEIRDGGISFIRVTDNGNGIPAEEISLAFLRHSTSKIRRAEDLFLVTSLGFRGEALSSIAAVAQVEAITRTPKSLTGVRYQIEGGEEKRVEEVGAPEGTTFIVRNLFYNTPVRRKFLKTAITEGAHVGDLVEKIALSHPEVSVRFIQNNQNKLYTSGNRSLKDIIYTVFGRELTACLLKVSQCRDMVTIDGFIGKPVIARSNRNFENYFVNGRYVKSSIITRAIEEAYRPFMMQHKYPFTMLRLAMEPELLDVNVHPAKRELRFQDEERVFQAVRDVLAETLAQKELIPEMVLEDKKKQEENREKQRGSQGRRGFYPEPFEYKRMEQKQPFGQWQKGKETHPSVQQAESPKPSGLETEIEKGAAGQLKGQAPVPQGQLRERQVPYGPGLPQDEAVSPEGSRQLELFEERLLEPKSRSRHKLIGQLFDTYWLVEFNNQLYIIDQHAAHEKVLYEQTMATLATREQTSQMVDPPIILSLGGREETLLKLHLTAFERIGFRIEHFGGREYAVRGVPDNLFSLAQKDLLMEMLDGLWEDIGGGNTPMVYEKIASMSCKAAVKGNHTMSVAEAQQLIGQVLDLENPYACPHGRPTILSMSKRELEKKFKRIV